MITSSFTSIMSSTSSSRVTRSELTTDPSFLMSLLSFYVLCMILWTALVYEMCYTNTLALMFSPASSQGYNIKTVSTFPRNVNILIVRLEIYVSSCNTFCLVFIFVTSLHGQSTDFSEFTCHSEFYIDTENKLACITDREC